MSSPDQQTPSWAQQPAPPQGWGQPPAPPKKKSAGKIVGLGCLGVVGLFVVLGIVGAIVGGGKSTTQGVAPAVSSPAAVAPVQPAAPSSQVAQPVPAQPGTIKGTGTYIVGTDIQPGTYKTDGPASSVVPLCGWERDKDAEGTLDSIIANGAVQGSAVVTIKASDKFFKSTGCKDWTKVG